MGNKESKSSFRIEGLNTTQSASFAPTITAWVSSRCKIPYYSLAQSGHGDPGVFTATASCPVKADKKYLMRQSNVFASTGKSWDGVRVDDDFSGLTMLRSPQNASIDICFIHGLNGNGMDTFATTSQDGKKKVVWPRDILPVCDGMNQARIMTYDYNSKVFASTDLSNDPKEWARDLLAQIELVRDVGMKDNRRIIFVAHSLGGLVVRFAAQELYEQRNTSAYTKLCIKDCGFIFLATPHLGSSQADFGPVSLALVHPLIGSRGRKIIRGLSTQIDAQKDDNQRVWGAIQNYSRRPIKCFAEGRKTSVLKALSRTIVTQDSAGFCGVKAQRLTAVDHKTICKVRNRLDGHYQSILTEISAMQRILLAVPSSLPAVSDTTMSQAARLAAPITASSQLQGQESAPETPPASLTPARTQVSQDSTGASTPPSISAPSAPARSLPPQTITSPTQVQPIETSRDIQVHVCLVVEEGAAEHTAPHTYVQDSKGYSLDVLDQLLTPLSHNTKHGSSPVALSASSDEKRGIALARGRGRGSSFVESMGVGAHFDSASGDAPSATSQVESAHGFRPVEIATPVLLLPEAETEPEISENLSARIKEAWQQKAVLSIDAGATRSFISLILLSGLMAEAEVLEKLVGTSATVGKPCHYFDYIGGTSTGGLIAIMLGRLRMDLKECIHVFKATSIKMFSRPRLLLPMCRRRYNVRQFETEYTRIIGREDLYFYSPHEQCQTIVTAVMQGRDKAVDTPCAFRSFDVLKYATTSTKQVLVWPVARATSAAPTYFKPMKIQGESYIDGGLMRNNPSAEIYSEALGHAGTVSTFVSLGSGLPKQAKEQFFKPGYFGVRVSNTRGSRLSMGFSMDSQSVHEAMQSLMKSVETEYYRFNVPLEPEMWRLDSWTKSRASVFEKLESVTLRHLKQDEVASSLRNCAKVLVERRKLREKDAYEWQAFARG